MDLWSGVIGAAISAVLAALVAVYVVWRSNKHQSQLAATALEAQRKDSALALEQQRDLLEQQILEQRQESRRLEKTTALSEFIAGVQEITSINSENNEFSVDPIRRRLEVAAAKLDILGEDDEGLHELLHPSIDTLFMLAMHRVADFKLSEDIGANEHLFECRRAICTLAPKWWSKEEAHRRQFIRGEIRLTLSNADVFLKENHPFANP